MGYITRVITIIIFILFFRKLVAVHLRLIK